MLPITNFLQNLGMSEKEAEIYLTSLKLGPQTATVIAKKTGISRSTVNYIFDELIKKGYATKESKKSTTYFSVLNPKCLGKKISDSINNQKAQLNQLNDLMPTLTSMANKMSTIPKITYFEGYDGLCRMLDDFCAEDQTVLYISGHNMMHPKIREYTYNIYLPISDKHKNKNKIILNDGKLSRAYSKDAKNSYDEFIFADSKKYPFKLTTAIYGNKTAFWSYDPSDMTGVIIENQLIADNMKTMFSALKELFKK